MNHIYQVIYHVDGCERVVYQTENEAEAYEYCERRNYFNTEFTYSYYDVDC